MKSGFLTDLNYWTAFLNSTLTQDCEVKYPFMFIVGAPRSGTTILAQVLAHCLDCGYICNLAARFWLAPIVGIRLAREVLGESMAPGFSSDYATTLGAEGIHEFGYFWRYWLRCPTNTGTPAGENVNWGRLRLALANIQRELGKPVVMKGVWPVYVANRINEVLGNVVWVNIKRDLIDNCISILEGRRNRGSINEWCCGWVPPEPIFSELDELGPFGQIVGQVTYWREYYAKIATHTVTLADLCADPMAVIERVRGGIPVKRRVPEGVLELRSHLGTPEERARFERLLK